MTPLSRYVVETLVTLTAVVALAILLLSLLRRAGIGKPRGPLELLARLPLDARRAVYLVRVGPTVYVLGASEAAMQKLGELPEGALPPAKEAPPPSFRDVLQMAFGGKTHAARPGPDAAPSPPRENEEAP